MRARHLADAQSRDVTWLARPEEVKRLGEKADGAQGTQIEAAADASGPEVVRAQTRRVRTLAPSFMVAGG